MANEILIRNGRMLDPARSIDSQCDIFMRDGKVAPLESMSSGSVRELNADGCLVVPGLIDFHAHLGRNLSDTGANPDLASIPNGITASVDAGSTGAAAAAAFVMDVVARSEITIKAFLHVSAVGVMTDQYVENPDPAKFDATAIAETLARYSDVFIGLKLRLGKGYSDGYGLSSFRRAKEIAVATGKPLYVHATNPEFPLADLVSEMDRGDYLCHCYQGFGKHTILTSNGDIDNAILRARERGVLFDAAVGRVNHQYSIIRQAFAHGFTPDIISTDLVAASLYDPRLFCLLRVMSMFLAVGMPLLEVVRCCTEVPARLMGFDCMRGTLAPGAIADVAILKLIEKPVAFTDRTGDALSVPQLLVPKATIVGGKILYEQIDFEY